MPKKNRTTALHPSLHKSKVSLPNYCICNLANNYLLLPALFARVCLGMGEVTDE